jgi:ParB-like chromosome segregation protein Spo0J
VVTVVEHLEDSVGDGLVYLRARESELANRPVQRVAVTSLSAAGSPRVAGEDADHTRVLAEVDTALPPIVVHRPTMRVVDGIHRLRAAMLNGHDEIDVRFFDGDEHDAFLLSVAMNAAHGLPLSLADRVAAAGRILRGYPHWSDRAVASVIGLSAKKVSGIRAGIVGGGAPTLHRIGRDGRTRPLDCTQGRERASELIKQNPDASLRQIAKEAGISPATVADVRNRLHRGDSPVPLRDRGPCSGERLARQPARHPAEPDPRSLDDLFRIGDVLRRDPSVRFTEAGRIVLRLFDACALAGRERDKILASVPPHCARTVADLLVGYAEVWKSLADDVRSGAWPQQTAETG